MLLTTIILLAIAAGFTLFVKWDKTPTGIDAENSDLYTKHHTRITTLQTQLMAASKKLPIDLGTRSYSPAETEAIANYHRTADELRRETRIARRAILVRQAPTKSYRLYLEEELRQIPVSIDLV